MSQKRSKKKKARNRRKSRLRSVDHPSHQHQDESLKHVHDRLDSDIVISSDHAASSATSVDGQPHYFKYGLWYPLICGVLAGHAVVWMVASIYTAQITIRPTVMTDAWNTSVSAALMAIAMGVAAPRRVASWLFQVVSRLSWLKCHETLHTKTASHESSHDLQSEPYQQDRSLYWMVVAGVSLFAGCSSASLVVWVPWVTDVHHTLYRGFLWSLYTGSLLTWLMTLVMLMLPLFSVGLLLRCLSRLGSLGPWTTAPLSGLLLGVALGGAVWHLLGQSMSFERLSAIANIVPAIASLPLLLISVLAGIISRPTSKLNRFDESMTNERAPMLEDRWPMLLRLCVVGVAMAAMMIVVAWYQLAHHVDFSLDTGVQAFVFACPLVCLSAGIMMGHLLAQKRLPTISGFGLACIISAMLMAFRVTMGLDDARWFIFVMMAAELFVLALAWAYGTFTLLIRVGRPSEVGAILLWRTFIVGSLYVFVLQSILDACLSTQNIVVITALLMMGMGGGMILCEPVLTTRIKRIRIIAVSATTIVLILTWPMVFG